MPRCAKKSNKLTPERLEALILAATTPKERVSLQVWIPRWLMAQLSGSERDRIASRTSLYLPVTNRMVYIGGGLAPTAVWLEIYTLNPATLSLQHTSRTIDITRFWKASQGSSKAEGEVRRPSGEQQPANGGSGTDTLEWETRSTFRFIPTERAQGIFPRTVARIRRARPFRARRENQSR